MQLMSQDSKYIIVRFAMLLALPKEDFHREAEDIHNRWFGDCAKKQCNIMIIALRMHKQPSSGTNRLSDVAVTVNINAEFNLSLI